MTEKTKAELLKELEELEKLENEVQEKKSALEYKKLEVPFKVGEKYFIRTVTYFTIGEIAAVVGQFIVFKKDTISWIADTGRFQQAINDGVLNEVEPVSVEGGVNVNSITDYFLWKHALPRSQK